MTYWEWIIELYLNSIMTEYDVLQALAVPAIQDEDEDISLFYDRSSFWSEYGHPEGHGMMCTIFISYECFSVQHCPVVQ